MALPSGTRLGTYTVTSLVGAGGMGEVYAAHDSKLGRDVAIKVLPEQFARDPERLARFQREAKMLAALNHPNIAAIYGLEQSGDTHYLVMELVPGQTLAERIRTGPVPVDEALAIAKQIAEALEAAHGSEKGIIHRDLKPANVKVTPEGRVKVLDFGLAKAFANDVASQDFSNSPTLSAMPTMQGVIMGTAAYMSPEQARGKTVTKASDIWAFGCVLYELLTGKQAFHGEDVTDILAAVVRAEPDWGRLPETTPPSHSHIAETVPAQRAAPAVAGRDQRTHRNRGRSLRRCDSGTGRNCAGQEPRAACVGCCSCHLAGFDRSAVAMGNCFAPSTGRAAGGAVFRGTAGKHPVFGPDAVSSRYLPTAGCWRMLVWV